MSDKLEDAIEQLVDRHGISTVVGAMAEVCYGKADHVYSNYGDEPLTMAWTCLAGVLSDVTVEPLNNLRLIKHGLRSS